jgi:RNA-binding protein 15
MNYRRSRDREISRDRDRRYQTSYNDRGNGRAILNKPSSNKQFDQREKYAGDFVSICLKNLNDGLSDSEIRDSVYQEFKRFGEFNVKVVYDRNTRDHRHAERIAFVNFNSHMEASEAKRCKMNAPFHGYPLYIEPVFKNKASDYRPKRPRSPRNRSRSISNDNNRKRFSSLESNKNRRYRSASRSPVPTIKVRQSRHTPPLTEYYSPPSVNLQMKTRRRAPSLTPPPQPILSRRLQNRREASLSSKSSGSSTSPHHSNGFKYRDHRKHIDPAFDIMANRTIFIGALDPEIEKEELHRLFERFGQIEEIDLKRVPNKKAYAFIRYVNLDMAYNAKCEMSGEVIGKFEIKIGYGN